MEFYDFSRTPPKIQGLFKTMWTLFYHHIQWVLIYLPTESMFGFHKGTPVSKAKTAWISFFQKDVFLPPRIWTQPNSHLILIEQIFHSFAR